MARFWRIVKIWVVALILGASLGSIFLGYTYSIVEEYAGIGDISKVPSREVALVLGTSKYISKNKINPYYQYRIDAAIELYKQGKVKMIIASGDSSEYYNEPKKMSEDLVVGGVPREKIVLDYAGLRTLDSVLRCKKIFGVNDPIIVSQDFHVRRALYLAQSSGMKNAVGFSAKSPEEARYKIRNEFREIFARAVAVLDVTIFNTRPEYEQ